MKTGRFFLIVFCLLSVSLSLVPSFPVFARNNSGQSSQGIPGATIIGGHIEDVNSQALRVQGNYYYFSGVPIVNERGQSSSPAALVPGREVRLYFQGGSLNEILVFERLLVQ